MDNVVFSIFVIKCLSLLRKTKQKNEIHAMFNRKGTASGNVCACVKFAGKDLLTGNRNGRKLF